MASVVHECTNNNKKESFHLSIVFFLHTKVPAYIPTHTGTLHIRLVSTGTQKQRNQDKIKTLEGLLARINIIRIHKKLIMSMNDIQFCRAR